MWRDGDSPLWCKFNMSSQIRLVSRLESVSLNSESWLLIIVVASSVSVEKSTSPESIAATARSSSLADFLWQYTCIHCVMRSSLKCSRGLSVSVMTLIFPSLHELNKNIQTPHGWLKLHTQFLLEHKVQRRLMINHRPLLSLVVPLWGMNKNKHMEKYLIQALAGLLSY